MQSINQPAEAGTGQEADQPDECLIDGSALWQPALPMYWRYVRPQGADPFAHQAERDFSAILSYYRIRWAYEPTSFPLQWGDDGRPCEMFTPDFYLPDQRLYIELTTMRQRLVTRKNRKLRRLRELYPDIRIKLLYRRDYHQLMTSYSRIDTGYVPGPVLVDQRTLTARLDQLAGEIARDELRRRSDERLLVIVASAGAHRFAAELHQRLIASGVRCDWDRVRVTRSRPGSGGGKVRLGRRPMTEVSGRRVLVITDVVSTGLSGSYLCRWLQQHGARDTAICTLLDRTEARITPVAIRYLGFAIPNSLAAGFGLRICRQYADFPHIVLLEPAAKDHAGNQTEMSETDPDRVVLSRA